MRESEERFRGIFDHAAIGIAITDIDGRFLSCNPAYSQTHDSRDKDAFVRELAHELAKNSCPVWYDEFSLKVGDSLRPILNEVFERQGNVLSSYLQIF